MTAGVVDGLRAVARELERIADAHADLRQAKPMLVYDLALSVAKLRDVAPELAREIGRRVDLLNVKAGHMGT
jgi:hypothetical protein